MFRPQTRVRQVNYDMHFLSILQNNPHYLLHWGRIWARSGLGLPRVKLLWVLAWCLGGGGAHFRWAYVEGGPAGPGGWAYLFTVLDTTSRFPKAAAPGSAFRREQAPSRKDSASQPRFSHNPPLPQLTDVPVGCVLEAGTAHQISTIITTGKGSIEYY